MINNSISQKNADYWDELCGSNLARAIGITDSSIESLKKFDAWYFNFYPYLFQHIPFSALANKKVLEVGLGYGTVAQKLAESGADYTGMDIAKGPVAIVNHRLAQNKLNGEAIEGSILEPKLASESFDYIVAIGCLHHTGNLNLAIQNCLNILKPGGQLIFMVYYAYSYRRYRMAPMLTIKNMIKETLGYRGVVGNSTEKERAAYDASSNGDVAPHTDWISEKSLRSYCSNFSSFKATIENIDQEFPFRHFSRKKLLATRLPSYVGLDIYVNATK